MLSFILNPHIHSVNIFFFPDMSILMYLYGAAVLLGNFGLKDRQAKALPDFSALGISNRLVFAFHCTNVHDQVKEWQLKVRTKNTAEKEKPLKAQ